MKADKIVLPNGMEKTAKPHKVFRMTNGRYVSRAIRDFYESSYEIGDEVDLYRVNKKQTVEVYPGDTIVRIAGTHPIE
jgi:hypothetical protein